MGAFLSYLYKTIRLQSIRFIILGAICLLLFGAVAIYVSPAIIAKFFKVPEISLSDLKIDEKYPLNFDSQNSNRPYQLQFSNIQPIGKNEALAIQYWLGEIETSPNQDLKENASSAIIIQADLSETLHQNTPFIGYIQPKDFMLITSNEEQSLTELTKQLTQQAIPFNPNWVITTESRSDAFGFAVFVLILALIPLLLLLHGGKLFLMPDRARELRYQRKHYYEDIRALSQDFDFEIAHKMAIKLKNAVIFQDFIVVEEAFRFYLIPLQSLCMLYPTRKFVFYSLLWFIPKTGINVYEEERAYFVKLPAKSIQKIMAHLQREYPYIERQKSKQHLRHAKKPEAVWQALKTRKAEYEKSEKKDHYYA